MSDEEKEICPRCGKKELTSGWGDHVETVTNCRACGYYNTST